MYKTTMQTGNKSDLMALFTSYEERPTDSAKISVRDTQHRTRHTPSAI